MISHGKLSFLFLPWTVFVLALFFCFSGKSVVFADSTEKVVEERVKERVEERARAFNTRDSQWAREKFEAVRESDPNNPVAAYYMGLLALKMKQVWEAINHWRDFVRLDPEGAKANGVMRQLTLLEAEVREKRMAEYMDNETKNNKNKPPEPNSIAVFDFINLGDHKYNILAKGLTTLVLADLSRIPGIKILERQKIQIIMNTIELSGSGLLRDGHVKAGRLLRAEKIFVSDFRVE